MKKKTKLGITIAVGLLGASLALTGCSFGILPTEQRYAKINNVVDQLNPTELGEVVEEGYDRGDGYASPSWYRAVVRGGNIYPILKERALSIEGIDCPYPSSDSSLTCRVGQVDVEIRILEADRELVDVIITDVYSGREVK